jgi:deazaflavin-dependent oxidoreductase (nitroreductase family)
LKEKDMNDFNQKIIDEFRANSGKVGGMMEGAPLLLLTTTGARSGRKIITPVMYLKDGDRLVVFASKSGAPTNPAWYHNLLAHHTATVELGADSFEVRAVETTGEERDRLYARQAQANPVFADYQTKTSRVIPVIALERVG